ncbi:hypothetical protein CEUSTIGMA_g6183.t1 [Chlamydomonas eustigma]|uniref:Uncharacterized protein n=1 Tax=Chlamydomonas eustigma TaxID=1157962 RepID=A0A250X6S8_9CHLO|nr:hypothetical protein CEUSTIGMA_g6183.t1 [Chlamydomonas eustigma]|eukprot:GAX78746.1 hypothetical protein CEUSTIGMA_g6183.t1 [Chlamydomonas eustigma]
MLNLQERFFFFFLLDPAANNILMVLLLIPLLLMHIFVMPIYEFCVEELHDDTDVVLELSSTDLAFASTNCGAAVHDKMRDEDCNGQAVCPPAYVHGQVKMSLGSLICCVNQTAVPVMRSFSIVASVKAQPMSSSLLSGPSYLVHGDDHRLYLGRELHGNIILDERHVIAVCQSDGGATDDDCDNTITTLRPRECSDWMMAPAISALSAANADKKTDSMKHNLQTSKETEMLPLDLKQKAHHEASTVDLSSIDSGSVAESGILSAILPEVPVIAASVKHQHQRKYHVELVEHVMVNISPPAAPVASSTIVTTGPRVVILAASTAGATKAVIRDGRVVPGLPEVVQTIQTDAVVRISTAVDHSAAPPIPPIAADIMIMIWMLLFLLLALHLFSVSS